MRAGRVRAIVKVDYASMAVEGQNHTVCAEVCCSEFDCPLGFGCRYTNGVRVCLPVVSTRLDIVSMQPPANPVDPAREHVRADSVIWGRINASGCAVLLTIAVGLIASSGKWANQPRQFATVRFH